MNVKVIFLVAFCGIYAQAESQLTDPFIPDPGVPQEITGMDLVWHDEFNGDGKPDVHNWKYENGFVRNEELQWYQPQNANCLNGVLVIEGRREKIANANYKKDSKDWRLNRNHAEYTSSSIKTQNLKEWMFGRFLIRARIDTSAGSWPAIWTLGTTGPWPSNGEIDIMEFYRVQETPTILANVAWGTEQQYVAKWDSEKKKLSNYLKDDPEWCKKFHIWRMDWTRESISLYLDDELINTTLLSETVNPDRVNPFLRPHYILLNLAIGSNGGDPSRSKFPIKYEVDYVRVYQEK